MKDQINKELQKFFNKKLETTQGIEKNMVKLLREYTLRGGKRIRAQMIVQGYNSIKKINKEIIKTSIAIELIQSYLLIHDDIIDNSDLRRGKPSMHKIYEQVKSPDPKQFGISMAIIIGDLASTYANEIITDSNFKEKRKNQAIKQLNKTVETVIYGQALDIISNFKKITKEQVKEIHKKKTASYTFEGPLKIGAILAGANNKQLKILHNYGINLGQAFQLQDDILGMFGEKEKIGKPIDSDLKEGKQTLLILKALEKANKKQKTTIKKALGNKKLKKSDLKQVQNIIKETNSLKHSQELSNKLTLKAKEIMQKSNLRTEATEFLLNIADNMLEREE